METLKISIYNKHLEELGIEQDDDFVDFNFNRKDLLGYWIVVEDEKSREIMIYLPGHKFVIPYKEKTVHLLNEILIENQTFHENLKS